MVHLLGYGQVFISLMWHYSSIPIGATGLFNPLRSYTLKCILVYVASLKNMLWAYNVFIIHESGYILW